MAEESGEGKQAQILRLFFRKAIEDITDGLPVAEVIQEVPGLKKKKPIEYSNLFKETLSRSLETVVASLFQDENIDQLLQSREELLNAQKDMEGTTAWRPSGSLDDDMRSYNMNILTAKRKQATAFCEKVEREVDTLYGQVKETRSRALEHQKKLVAAENKIKTLFQYLDNQDEALSRITESLTNF